MARGGMCGRGHVSGRGCVWQGGMCGRRGVHGRGCVWQGVCMSGRTCMAGQHVSHGGHAWQGGICGRGCVWQGYVCDMHTPPRADTTAMACGQ